MIVARARRNPWRRAGVLIAVLIALAWINLAVIGAVVGAGDDAQLSAWRIEALRAGAAAESAIRIATRLQQESPDTPAVGRIELPGGAAALITDPFEAPPEAPGIIKVEATDGEATQRRERYWAGQP